MTDINAMSALFDAQNGDNAKLLTRLRDPQIILTTEEREFIAGRLDRSIKLKRGTKSEGFELLVTAYLSDEIVQRLIRRGDKPKYATEYAAKMLAKSDSTIRNDIERVKEHKGASAAYYRILAINEADQIFATNSEK